MESDSLSLSLSLLSHAQRLDQQQQQHQQHQQIQQQQQPQHSSSINSISQPAQPLLPQQPSSHRFGEVSSTGAFDGSSVSLLQPVMSGLDKEQDVDSLGGGGGAAAGEEADEGDKKKRRRNRKPVTCQQCRKRKLKCDRGAPCGACKDRNEGEACEWEGAIRLPQSNYSRDQEAVELRAQLDRLEGLLESLGTTTGGFDSLQDQVGGVPSGSRSSKTDGRFSRGSAFERERDIAAEALGLLAGPGSPRQPLQPSIFSLGGTTLSYSALLSSLPTPQELDMHISQFLTSPVTSFVPLVHTPSFLDRYRHFTHQRNTNSSLTTQQSNAPFLAFLLAVCGWEIYWSTRDPRSHRPGPGGTLAKEIAARNLFQTSIDTLHFSRFLEKPSIEDVRTLLLLQRYYTHLDNSTAFAMNGLGIQIAQSLGLDVAPYSRFNFVEAEERRRLWTILVSSDWLDSSSRNYICSPLQSDSLLPTNAHDSDITPTSVLPHSLHVPTPLHSLIFRSRLSVLARSITDRAYSLQVPPSWNTILELNAELSRVAEELPACFGFEWQEGAIKCWSREREGRDGEALRAEEETRVEIHLILRSMFIRLHRPFLSRGYSDHRFTFSREKCCWAARYTLAIHRGLGTDYRAIQSWSLTFHALNALLILAIDLFQDPTGPYSQIHRTDIATSLHLLNSNPAPSALMRECLHVVSVLLRRSSPSSSSTSFPSSGSATMSVTGSSDEVSKNNAGDSNGNGSGGGGQALLRPFEPTMSFRIPLPTPMNVDPLAPIPSNPTTAFSNSNVSSASSSVRAGSSSTKRSREHTSTPSIGFGGLVGIGSSGSAIGGGGTAGSGIGVDTKFDDGLLDNERELVHLWSMLRAYKRLYAVPDWEEWEEMRSGRFWSRGIDLN